MAISSDNQDALTELLNIGVGKAAEVLNQMIDSHVSLAVPSVKVLDSCDLVSEFGVGESERLASVCLEFHGGFSGATSLVFTTPCAVKLVEALTGEAMDESCDGDEEIDSIRVGALIEVGNILINGVMGSIGNVLNTHLEYRVPNYAEGTVRELIGPVGAGDGRQVVVAKTKMSIEQFEVQGDIVLCLELGTFSVLVESLVGNV